MRGRLREGERKVHRVLACTEVRRRAAANAKADFILNEWKLLRISLNELKNAGRPSNEGRVMKAESSTTRMRIVFFNTFAQTLFVHNRTGSLRIPTHILIRQNVRATVHKEV